MFRELSSTVGRRMLVVRTPVFKVDLDAEPTASLRYADGDVKDTRSLSALVALIERGHAKPIK